MNKIDLWRLRELIKHGIWRDTFVASSVYGGWFLSRSKVHG
ncbi:MAG: hypothetical protein WC073_10940 [Sterolibacterium sp.]